MAEIGSCQVGGCVSQATAPFLLSASRVPSCIVATRMSRTTTAKALSGAFPYVLGLRIVVHAVTSVLAP